MGLEKQELIDYFRIVGALEWIIADANNGINELEDEKQQMCVNQKYEKQQFNKLSFYIKRFALSFLISVVVWRISTLIFIKVITLFYTPQGHAPLDYMFFIMSQVLSVGLSLFLLFRSKGFRLLGNYLKGKKDNVVNSIKFSQQENQRFEGLPNQIADIEYQQLRLSNLASKAEYELEQTYEDNILHPRYRNLAAILAMYEYFQAGSADTLKEAMNKYDMESRLDNMIEHLGEINQTTRKIYDELEYQTQLAEKNLELSYQQLGYAKEAARNTAITAMNTGLLLLIEERRELRRGY